MVIAPFLVLALQDVARPRLTQIVVEDSSVWFISEPTGGGEAVGAYVYDRRTAEWRRAPLGATPAIPRPWPGPGVEPPFVGLGPDFNLVYLTAGDTVRPAIVSRRDAHVYRPEPAITATDRRRLGPAAPLGPLGAEAADPASPFTIENAPVALFSNAWTHNGKDVWFGLRGGFTEQGHGGIGGLVRFDLKTHRTESVWSRDLLSLTVSGLVVVGDALWIATVLPRELLEEEGAGLLRYDLKRRTWRRYVGDSSGVPGGLILALGSDRQRLWVTTPDAIAALDTRSGAWKVWSFELALSGDTIVREIVPGKHVRNAARERIFASLWALQPSDPHAFLRTSLAADSTGSGAFDLAQPALTPFLVEALRRGGWARQLGADALGRLGDPQWIPALRAVLDTNQSSESAHTAVALGLLGDSIGFRWVRDRMRAVHGNAAVWAAGRLRDSQNIPLLVPLLRWSEPRRGLQADAYTALATIGTPAAWIALARGVECPNERHRTCEKWRLFSDYLRSGSGVPVDDSAFRAALGETAIASLLDSAPDVRGIVPKVVARLGRIDAWPQLVGMLTRGQDDYRVATETLIRLTTVDSGPTPPVADSAQRAQASAFWSHWFDAVVHGPTGLHAASPADGDAAIERWRRRWR